MNQKQICRTCLSEFQASETRSLFAPGKIMGLTLNLSQMLIACANLKIAKNDGLPQEICLPCIHIVSRAFSFKIQCERNQQILLRRTTSVQIDTTPSRQSLVVPLKMSPEEKEVTSSHEIDSVKDSVRKNYLGPENVQNEPPPRKTLTKRIIKTQTNRKVTLGRRILYRCKICGETFPTELMIKNHRAQKHSKLKIAKCQLCDKVYRTEEQMKRHINIHNTGKPLQCETCGKAFSQKADYVAHTYTHTGERPFLCNQCGKSFRRSSELIIHMRTHLDLRPYHCKICGNRYRTSSSFAIHKRSHTGERPFACKDCNKAFKSSNCLRNHILTHTGEKKHTCEYCGRGFSKAYTLTVHKRIHTQERPHVCTVCGKGFNQAVCLRTHMKLHEKTEQS